VGQPVVLERLGKLRSWYATVFNHRMPVQYVQSATIERPNAVAVRRYVSCKIALSMENERKLWMIAYKCILLARRRLQSEVANHRNAFGQC
jgi:hypothetical protein